MCYQCCVNLTPSNIEELISYGLGGGNTISLSAPYIGIQFGTRQMVGMAWHGMDCPIIRMKHVAPLLLLPNARARIDYLYEEFLIDTKTYKHLCKSEDELDEFRAQTRGVL